MECSERKWCSIHAELIAVGTELLLGQIVDTHSAFLSRELAQLGIHVYYHSSVGDNQRRLKETIQLASSRSDLIVLTGGLGPTEDDLSKETLAEVLGESLVMDPAVLNHIQSFFNQRGRSMPRNNRKQALVFKEGVVFENKNGTAPGLGIRQGGKTFVLLPGPPHELIPMFKQQVRPYLMQLLPEREVVISRVLRFFRIGESYLAEKIHDLIRNQTNPTIAPLAKDAEVTLRLTAKAEDQETAEQLIDPVRMQILTRVGEYCYGEGEDPLEAFVLRMLKRRGQTVALAESCTGGLATQLLTTIPGSSRAVKGGIVCYTESVKEELLKVPSSTLHTHGAVSMETALILAEQVRQQLKADLALSITGVAGPEAVDDEPVGSVYVGLAERKRPTRAYHLSLTGSRQTIQRRAAKHALFILLERLKKGETTI